MTETERDVMHIDMISNIKGSSSALQVFPDLKIWKDTYRDYMKQLHPDICKAAGAPDAVLKLNHYKEELENGKSFRDDAGTVTYTLDKICLQGDDDYIVFSHNNYKILKGLKDEHSIFFQRYIPGESTLEKQTAPGIETVIFPLRERAIPLFAVADHFDGQVPQEHVNWILNRILEFCCWMQQADQVHCGINPESIFIIPENHGMLCTSFYHMIRMGRRVSTISGKYRSFYPPMVFDRLSAKIATPQIDLELAMRTAIYLLGSKTGNSAKLRKTHNNELLNFYSAVHTDAPATYQRHQEIVNKFFPKQFIPLTI